MEIPAAKTNMQMNMPERLAKALHKSLIDGELSKDTYLPSSRELASRYGTSVPTMQKALRKLRDNKVIRLHSQRRGFVQINRGNANNKRNGIKQIAVLMPKRPDRDIDTLTGWAKGDDWSGNIVERMTQCLSVDHYHCIPIYYDVYKNNPPHENIPVETALSRIDHNDGFDGVLFCARDELNGLTDELDSRNIRWATINPMPGHTGNFVAADNLEGGRIVGKYFARMGFERILYLCSTVNDVRSSAMGRLTGLLQAFVQEGASLKSISFNLTLDGYELGAKQAVIDYLENNGPPDAIFCAGDYMALGAIYACQEKGCSIPEQVSIIGGTGLQTSSRYSPRLSVIAQPMMKMGDELADMFREMTKNGSSRLPCKQVPSNFIMRESVKIDNAVIESLRQEFGEQIVVDV